MAKLFPIIRPSRIHPCTKVPAFIRWDALNEEQAQINHGQSLAMLASRGGLAPCEAVAIIEHRRWQKMRIDDALAIIEPFTV